MNPLFLPIAAAEASAVHYLGGMLMVILTLTALLVLMTLSSLILRKLFPYEAPPAPAPSALASTSQAAKDGNHEGIEPEVVAAIAAAVATTLGSNHRVVSIKQKAGSWEKAGRQSILSSHRIR